MGTILAGVKRQRELLHGHDENVKKNEQLCGAQWRTPQVGGRSPRENDRTRGS